MPRASSVLPTVNSAGHQEVNISNTSLAVNDATAQASLSAINGKITACDTSAVAVSSSALPSGASTSANQSTANSSLASIDGKITACDTSALATASNQSSGNSSLASIDSKLTAPLQVSSSVTISGSHGNLSNAASVSSGDFSSAVDISGKSNSSVMIDLDSSDSIEVWVSGDGSNYNLHGSIYPMSSSVGAASDYYGYLKLNADVISHLKLKYTASGTATASIYSRV
tara:strand:+ start:128 stop:811 length:684 start_codon:yes stop_codon:yes gene_type:complete